MHGQSWNAAAYLLAHAAVGGARPFRDLLGARTLRRINPAPARTGRL
jgi:hypothetical protein